MERSPISTSPRRRAKTRSFVLAALVAAFGLGEAAATVVLPRFPSEADYLACPGGQAWRDGTRARIDRADLLRRSLSPPRDPALREAVLRLSAQALQRPYLDGSNPGVEAAAAAADAAAAAADAAAAAADAAADSMADGKAPSRGARRLRLRPKSRPRSGGWATSSGANRCPASPRSARTACRRCGARSSATAATPRARSGWPRRSWTPSGARPESTPSPCATPWNASTNCAWPMAAASATAPNSTIPSGKWCSDRSRASARWTRTAPSSG
ncbi:hypothetical protein FE772_04080 [Lysobacter enzymogenes]|nr:hypothetical protein FE772_04080 [Lysobacter enzymogenes]